MTVQQIPTVADLIKHLVKSAAILLVDEERPTLQKVLTRGRTDHFSTNNSTNNQKYVKS